ncbi:PHP domain-containing protein [Entomospira entomophila]|uniref:PHP domain-containing protein n=1 Tax=Entomospira entomophila TaxID=2719988 RepID=A0A968KR03_9SPIO|nr:PHP domain-containing protein [Entomospira entomophilus]NIZ40304.1 PHP domain-containing protein [Entomospira entomophilus]WDI35863.1 PHP domain-containing protein [Entomospira entomophilus]
MIDLHSHSTASDGADHPRELIQLAYSKGVRTLALTDHDTLTGLDEAAEEAKKLSLLFLYGVEIEINASRGVFHLLGLNLDPSNAKGMQQLQTALEDQQRKRENRNQEIVQTLNHLGLFCDYDEIRALASDVVGRVHIARYLFQKGYVKSQQMAFDKYLATGRPAFIRKESFDLEQAVTLIHQAGGKAIVAHPLSLYQSWRGLEESFHTFEALGVDGLEAYHSNCKVGESRRLVELAKKFDWIVTGGSDYHGAKYLSRKLGYATAGEKIDSALLEPLLREDQRMLWHRIQQQ